MRKYTVVQDVSSSLVAERLYTGPTWILMVTYFIISLVTTETRAANTPVEY